MNAGSADGRLSWLLPAVIAGLGIVAGQSFSRFTFGLLFPRMGISLVGSTSTSSLLAAVYAGAYLVGVVLLIYATRHVAPPRLLVTGLGVSAAGLWAIGVAHSEMSVLVGLGVTGVGADFTYVPALSFVTAAVPPQRRLRAIGLAGGGIGFGIIVARVLAAVFQVESSTQGWRYVWISEALFAAGVTVLVLVYSLRVPSVIEDRGMPLSVTLKMPYWFSLGMAYLCFGFDYSIFSNLAVKGWELGGLSGQGAANALVFVAPAQMCGGFVTLWMAGRLGVRRTAQASFILLGLGVLEVAGGLASVVPSVGAALVMGFVGAGITTQFVIIVRFRMNKLSLSRDATTTVFGVITLMYSFGGLVGLVGGAQLSRGGGSLVSTFVVAGVVAFLGVLFARRGTTGLIDDVA